MTIKELRASKKLSQAAFAKSIDAGVSTIIRYESGKTQPSAKVIAKIKEVYGVDILSADAPAAEVKEAPKAKAKKPRAPRKAAKAPAEEVKPEAAPAPVEEPAPAPVEEAPAPVEEPAPAPVEEAKPAKKAPRKAAKKPAAKKPAAKKAPAKKAAKAAAVIIQSPMGGEITPEDILAKVGEADTIYVRVDENKAYWVRGEESGSVELW